MKYITSIIVLIIVLLSSETHAQKTWEHYYLKFRYKDPVLQMHFPPPYNDTMKSWKELNGRERRIVKRRLKYHYQVRPNFGGYLVGAFKTIFRSVGHTAIYIATMGATALIVGAIINENPTR